MRPDLSIVTAWLTAFALAGCAGKVAGSEPDGGSSSGGGGSGSGGSSGSASSSSSGGSPTGACASACMRILALACSQPPQTQADCQASCDKAQLQAQMAGCSSQYGALLECIDQAPLRCNAQGLDSSPCQTQIAAVGACTSPPPPVPPGCEGIPPNTSGNSTCSGEVGPNGGGGFMTSCSDGLGNTWSATCSGGSCSCSYDGRVLCTCASDGGASASCCPGT